MKLTDQAYMLLKSSPWRVADAQRNAKFNNSILGAVMAFTTRKPRWATEEAVRSALKRIAEERRKPRSPLR